DAGADDYITKPFSTPELLARLRAAQRKTRPSEEVSVFKNGDLVVDLTAHMVTRAGREIKLSATEYALLRLFVKHPGRVLTHRHILREIWGPESEEHRQYLRVYVTHLRQKIEADPAKPSLIQTQPGIGYRFPGKQSQALTEKALASERAHNRESLPLPMAQLIDDIVLDASAGVHRPRNLDWKRAAALLYGDWGTSKACVMGLAFVAAGFSSLPIILCVCALTGLVGINYIVICRHFPD